METVSGLSNWKLTLRREADHIEILRAVTCDRRAVLPDRLFDLPVTVLGDHALAPNARPVPGEEVRVTCGPEGEWDNRELRELTLPAFLTDVQNYALYGCRSLHTLHLHDRVDRWGGCCLMNCRELNRLSLTRVGDRQGEALAVLCGELHDELSVHIFETDGTETRLIFPEYAEIYEENVPNHHFDYHIHGGGHPYHHGFRAKQLDLRVYDGLWDKYLREEHEPATALRLAYTRLRWPADLGARAKEQYRNYLASRPREALLWQLTQQDAQGLRLLLEELDIPSDVLHAACEQARGTGNTEALALLLERQHQQEPTGFDKDFDL
ncbi:MAG: hypothetical protein IJA84_04955 [Clostridia bacterium]|nr:hypothetical protein [Clostridia bacterium]